MALELDPEVPVGLDYKPQPTLNGASYYSTEVWEQEKEALFFQDWFSIARVEEVAEPGDFLTRDVIDQSVVVTRNKQGELRAFYNSCAHRGTRLCDGEGSLKSGVIVCPYHAWTFDADGKLLGTPNVHEEEGFDKTRYPLFSVAVDTWEGWIFVNLAEQPRMDLQAFIDANPQGKWDFQRYGMPGLRVGKSITYEVEANWKIILENFNECLHCPSVHPELVAKVPIFRKGRVIEREDWGGNKLIPEATTLTESGSSNRPPLPGLTDEDIGAYFGYYAFPNMMFNFHSDCVMTYRLEPTSPTHTRIISEYFFHPDTIASPDFDPSDIADFWDLVSKQDWEVCERAQVGVRSRGYRNGGVYPYNDREIVEFNEYYAERMNG